MTRLVQLRQFGRMLGVAACVVPLGAAGAQAQPTIPAMRQYVDPGFGFSFWYPAQWTVKQDPGGDPTDSGWFQGGRIVKRLAVTAPQNPSDGDCCQGATMEEIAAPEGSLTELGHTMNLASPMGVDQKYFFDPKTHIWMDTTLSESPDGSPPSTQPLGNGMKTMGGLPIFYGASRHGAEVTVPLNRTHFVVLYTNDAGGDQDHLYVAETIAGSDAAKRPNARLQADVVRLEARKLGVIGQSLGYWYKDGEHVYNSQWKVLPGVNPKMFAPLSQDGPNFAFASDGIHVFDDLGVPIPGADPKTFVATGIDVATDAHHTYEWHDGELKIDGVAVPK